MTINTAFFDAITEQANRCDSCAAVHRLAAQALPQLQTVLDGIADAEAILAAGQSLLSLNPADLPGVISFLSAFKTSVLTPMLAPYAQLVAQATETAAAVASATAAVESAAARFPGCTL